MKITFGILAHVDAGKTTLSESILYHTHSIRSMGRVDHQDAFLDAHPLEKARGITIFSDQAMFSMGEDEYFLVDTPGHVDFAAEMERNMSVLDYAVLVVSCAEGIQAHTETIWSILRRNHIPTFIFLNKIDRTGADPEHVMAELKRRFSTDCVAAEDLPEAVAERDEALLERYLDGKVTFPELMNAAAEQISREELFVCYRGSALMNQGVVDFLESFHQLTKTKYCTEKPFGAQIFRIRHDAQGNRLTFVKVVQGALHVKDSILLGENTYRVNELRLYNGSRFSTVREVEAGTLAAIVGLPECRVGDALGECTPFQKPVTMPLLSACVEYPPEVSVQTVLAALKKLDAEEPMLGVQWNEQLQQIHIRIMGVIQLEVLREIIRERFGLEVEFGRPEIMYRETIAAPVHGAGHYEPLRHYAEVHLALSPLPRGSGIEFGSRCSVDDLELQYQNLVRTHVFEKEHKGTLTGSPLTDVRVELLAGRAHLKHTEGGDFRQATYRAIRQGLMKAKSVLLEPYYAFVISAPLDNMGRVLSDIQRLYGSFDVPVSEGDTLTVQGRGPVATFMDYAQELTAFTKGKGHMSARFDGYEPCHDQQIVVDRLAYNANADKENDADSVFCAKGAGFSVHWDKADDWMHCDVQDQLKALNLSR